MSNQSAAFVVNCTECEMETQTDELDEATEFYGKHREHTGHELEWESADLNIDTGTSNIRWEVICPECGETKTFDAEEEAEEYYDEHQEFTTHSPTQPQETEQEPDMDLRSVKRIIERYEPEFTPKGVPIPVILLEAEETEINNVDEELERLQSKGEIYEVDVGYYRAT